ncbi:MAG: DUF5709 domain-containing protein [Candidatus Nanopelagicales bacterium]|nr:DUF5709 domain-containing protein [Candidatus Nanopelagicales bacterium]MDZ4249038.1 DUF5709 domain-containing protein [Candidatus Nanopelagicales bacterium]
MSRHGRSSERYDPAKDVVEEMYHEISEDLGTDGPEETFGHPDESVIGRLVEEDEGVRPDTTSEVLAFDSHDVSDLSAEEAAVHLVADEEEEAAADPTLTRAARRALEDY